MSTEQCLSRTSAHQRANLLVKKHGAVSIEECSEVLWYEPYNSFDIYEARTLSVEIFLVKQRTDEDVAHALIHERFGLGDEVEIHVW
ncbi:hypothetical protein ASE98_23395 [Pseudomonas sp. Leaf48]|uniref:hypothetical protein n=1 Tax=Pseudomonas sp. Leaf48 TaxID=1736221 RepID=UPI00072AE2B2|nr:hypothetical protein [Pseudomonas sp. Leaf48]KQN50470.1 hypothetical protein ASE98_23395 [Pseudomonas sp. Leaf48]